MANLRHYIDPGEMDRRVTLQNASGSQDAYGEGNTTWYDVAELWAKFEAGVGNEGVDAEQVAQHDIAVFTIRYRSVVPRMRIVMDDEKWDIETVSEAGGRKRFLKLRCKRWDSNPI